MKNLSMFLNKNQVEALADLSLELTERLGRRISIGQVAKAILRQSLNSKYLQDREAFVESLIPYLEGRRKVL